MEEADLFTPMETCTRGSGRTTRLREKESTHTETEPSTMDTGRVISKMDSGKKCGLTELCTRETTCKGRNMDRDSSSGQMGLCMTDSF